MVQDVTGESEGMWGEKEETNRKGGGIKTFFPPPQYRKVLQLIAWLEEQRSSLRRD